MRNSVILLCVLASSCAHPEPAREVVAMNPSVFARMSVDAIPADYDMLCTEIEGASGLLQRCQNDEVICYMSRSPQALSCVGR